MPLDELLCRRHITSDGLLAENMLPRLEHFLDDGGLGEDGQAHSHGSNIVAREEIIKRLARLRGVVVVDVDLSFGLLGDRGGGLGRARVDCLELVLGASFDGWKMGCSMSVLWSHTGGESTETYRS